MLNLLRFRARAKPDYGIDAPRIVRGLLIAGLGATAAGLVMPSFYLTAYKITLIGPTLLALGCLSLGLCGSMLAYSLRGKFNIRNRMLTMIRWRGDEIVLDIGTGRALLAAGAAKRLRSGTVTGIDIWQPSDLTGNTLENAQKNIEIEGVQDRVELRSDDARNIGFVDNSFDVVLSLLCLHKIEDAEGRASACREVARVLKPRGIAVIADCTHTADYARSFEAAGLKVQGPKSHMFEAYTALAIIVAHKR